MCHAELSAGHQKGKATGYAPKMRQAPILCRCRISSQHQGTSRGLIDWYLQDTARRIVTSVQVLPAGLGMTGKVKQAADNPPLAVVLGDHR